MSNVYLFPSGKQVMTPKGRFRCNHNDVEKAKEPGPDLEALQTKAIAEAIERANGWNW